MFDKIFRRVETKYVLDEKQYQIIMNRINKSIIIFVACNSAVFVHDTPCGYPLK